MCFVWFWIIWRSIMLYQGKATNTFMAYPKMILLIIITQKKFTMKSYVYEHLKWWSAKAHCHKSNRILTLQRSSTSMVRNFSINCV